MNNIKKQFILPKMQKVQKNDLVSILTLQPKTVSEFEQHGSFEMSSTENSQLNTKKTSNNEFPK